MRGNIVVVDIPEEISQFAELKTLTEDVGRNERVIPSGERRSNGGREKSNRSRGAHQRSDVKVAGGVDRERRDCWRG